ncbi:MAG: cysteine hydrolase [Chloroflexi bacterium]|nr:cysteine hydrolase [Chloroflexota bacterium]
MSEQPGAIDRSAMIEAVKAHLTIDPKTTAVVAVDMHRGHLDPTVATMPVEAAWAGRVVKEAARCLSMLRSEGIPVIHVTLVHRSLPPDGSPENTRNPFWVAVEAAKQQLTPVVPSTIVGHNRVGSPGTQVIPELLDPRDIVLTTKRRLSSFMGTDLDITLRSMGIKTTIIMGINTNTCVQNLAFDCFNRDYATVCIAECVASMYGEDLHYFGLQNIQRCFGWVLTIDELAAKLGVQAAAASR